MTKLLVKLFVKNYTDIKNPEVRARYGVLSGVTGIIANLFLFGGKLFAGIVTGAISIIADALNNLSDAFSSIITLIGFKFAGAPADDEHPFGHGRAEYIAGMCVSILIIVMGFELGKSSVERIFAPEVTEFSVISIVILGIAILVKLGLCFFNRGLAKLVNSSTMKATAMDSLSDVCATSVVIIGIVISTLTGFSVDGYIGILVAAFIIYTGIQTIRDSLNAIIGQKPDKELVSDIAATVVAYKGIVGIHDLVVHSYGAGFTMITLHAEVPADMDFVAAHELIDVIEDDLKIRYKCVASIHMDPIVMNDAHANELKNIVREIINELDDRMSIHDFRMTKGEQHENLIFDIVVPYKFRLSDKEIIDFVREKIFEIDEKYCAVIEIDKQMS